MFGDARDDVIATGGVLFRRADEGKIVGFGCAAGEDNFVGLRVDPARDLTTRLLNSLSGGRAILVVYAGSIAKTLIEVRQHCLKHARVDRRGRVMIHVNGSP